MKKMKSYREYVGIHGGYNVVQKIWLPAEKFLGRLAHHGLRLLRVARRDAVPGLGLAPVQVVDRRGPMVLGMPAEGGEAHTDVEPGNFHTRDVHVDGFQDGVGHHRQAVQVPIGLRQNFFWKIKTFQEFCCPISNR